MCQRENIGVVELNLEKDLNQQGPFDLILHRVSDLIGQMKAGDHSAAALLTKFKNYARLHPQMIVLDPLSSVQKLSNRYRMYRMIRTKLAQEDVQVPMYVRIHKQDTLEKMRSRLWKKGVTYPILAKPLLAHKHELVLIFNEDGLKALSEDRKRFPLILQNYIPHDGVLYKIYVIGDRVEISPRPSLRNLRTDSERKAITFHSHQISKPKSKTNLHPNKEKPLKTPNPQKVKAVARRLAQITNLTLIGMDLILERGTGRHFLIDINYFPGYDEVSQVAESLFAHVKMNLQKCPLPKESWPESERSEGMSDSDSTADSEVEAEPKFVRLRDIPS